MFALRAFNVETASVVERSGGGDLFVQTRFKWWLDAVTNLYKENPPRNPIFTALAHILQEKHLTRYKLKKIVETRLQDALRKQPPETLSDVELYAEGTATQLLQLQVRILR